MKTKKLAIGLILMAFVLSPLAIGASGDGPRGQRGHRREGGPEKRLEKPQEGVGHDFASMLLGRFGERLDLTEEQKEQIKAVFDANKKNAEAARDAVRETMRALNEAVEGGVEAEIIAAGKAVGDAFTEQALQRANIAKQAKALLTEDQLAQLENAKEQMKERMQQRRPEGRDGKGPRQGSRGQRRPRPEPEDEPAVEN